MFERFTDRARRVIVLAQQEGRLLRHDFIGTEHLVLGLLALDQGVAARVLGEFEVSLDDARAKVAEQSGRRSAPGQGRIPFAPAAKRGLEAALREALRLGVNYIDTEHVLLGVLRQDGSPGVGLLDALGADPLVVRDHVMRVLAEERPPPVASPVTRPFGRVPTGRLRRMSGSVLVADDPDLGLEQLGDDVLRALVLAREEVRRTRAPDLAPEHLLAGLLGLGGPTAGLLEAAGVSLGPYRIELDAITQPGEDPLPPNPRLAPASWDALVAAAADGEPVTPLGLLTALVATSTSVRALFRSAGGNLEVLRDRLAGAEEAG